MQYKSTNKVSWAAGIIQAILGFSQSLWIFCCQLLQGKDTEERIQLQLASLQAAVTGAYVEYAADPFVVSRSISCIFTIPLTQHL
jgi:hypothetical protein